MGSLRKKPITPPPTPVIVTETPPVIVTPPVKAPVVKRVLLLPGIGDIHWVFLIMEDFMKKNGIDKIIVDVWNFDGRPRSKDFVDMVDFAQFGEYVTLPRVSTDKLHQSDKFLQANFHGYDYFIALNGMLHERGVRIESILPQYKVNWDYKINFQPGDDELYNNTIQRYGREYALCFFSSHGMFQQWVKHFTTRKAMDLLTQIYDKTGWKIILTGKRWDSEYNVRLKRGDSRRILINNVGNTETLRQFLYLVKNAQLFVGFCGGNTMVSSHFGTPTIMLWSNHFRDEFHTNWIQPEKVGQCYWPLKVEWPDMNVRALEAVEQIKKKVSAI